MPSSNNNSNTNPWESAANDRLYNQQEERRSSLRLNPNNHDTMGTLNPAAAVSSSTDTTTTSTSCIMTFWNILYSLDILMALTIGGYGGFELFFQNNSNSHNSTKLQHARFWVLVMTMILCTCGILRGILAGRRKQGRQQRQRLSRLILQSHFLACGLFLLISLIVWILYLKNPKHSILLQLLDEELLPWKNNHNNNNNYKNNKIIPSIFLGLGIWEGIRYILLVMGCHDYGDLYNDDDNNDDDNGTHGGSVASRRSTPWWWSRGYQMRNNRHHHEEHNQALLSHDGNPHWSSDSHQQRGYLMEDGVDGNSSRRRSSWWPFGGRRGNNNDDDDGSVDYASLSEDWASRSQDDPFWWTKEGETTTAGTTTSIGGGQGTSNPAWASPAGGLGNDTEV